MAESKDNLIGQLMQVVNGGADEMLRRLMEIVIQSLLEAEMTELIGAEKYERTSERKGHRNGYKPRKFTTRVGTIELEIPQDREGRFRTEIFDRYQRMDKALIVALQEMYIEGVSTRKVRKITEKLCGKEVSKSMVSRLSSQLDEELKQWRERRLEDSYPVIYADAQFHKVREGGSIISKAVMTIAGVRASDGRREILSIETTKGETGEGWKRVFDRLKERGLHGVQIVVSDAHQGLIAAIDKTFAGVPWQRCQAHFTRNTMDITPNRYKDDVAQRLRIIFNAPDREDALKHKQALIERYEHDATKLSDFIDENIENCFSVYVLPEEWRKRARTTNMLERYHSEIRRRTRVVRIFPNESSLLRLVSAVGKETSDEWVSSLIPYLAMDKEGKAIEPGLAAERRCVS